LTLLSRDEVPLCLVERGLIVELFALFNRNPVSFDEVLLVLFLFDAEGLGRDVEFFTLGDTDMDSFRASSPLVLLNLLARFNGLAVAFILVFLEGLLREGDGLGGSVRFLTFRDRGVDLFRTGALLVLENLLASIDGLALPFHSIKFLHAQFLCLLLLCLVERFPFLAAG